MKKLFFILSLCLMSTFVWADDTCLGTVRTGQNGHVYCQSKQGMTWYQAFAWCDAQGRHLSSLNEACDIGGYVWGKNTTYCLDAQGGNGAEGWLSNVNSSGKAYRLYANHYLVPEAISKDSIHYAFCY